MKRALVALYRGWMRFAHALGAVQTFLILLVIYFVAIGLISPLVRLVSGDPLDRRSPDGADGWSPNPKSNRTLAEARHLF